MQLILLVLELTFVQVSLFPPCLYAFTNKFKMLCSKYREPNPKLKKAAVEMDKVDVMYSLGM